MNENCLELATKLVSKCEGFCEHAYQDGAGIWTIGFGSTYIEGRIVYQGDTCTREQAELWLRERIEKDAESLDEFCKEHSLVLEDHEAASLLSFIYNCGFGAFEYSSMAKDLISGRKENVLADIEKWNKIRIDGKLQINKGLVKRRELESACFLDEAKCSS